jgi:hypothetical protein
MSTRISSSERMEGSGACLSRGMRVPASGLAGVVESRAAMRSE